MMRGNLSRWSSTHRRRQHEAEQDREDERNEDLAQEIKNRDRRDHHDRAEHEGGEREEIGRQRLPHGRNVIASGPPSCARNARPELRFHSRIRATFCRRQTSCYARVQIQPDPGLPPHPAGAGREMVLASVLERRDNAADRETPSRARPDIYAALDLGTNNCRLLIARPACTGMPKGAESLRVVDAFSRIVRLGEGLLATRPAERRGDGADPRRAGRLPRQDGPPPRHPGAPDRDGSLPRRRQWRGIHRAGSRGGQDCIWRSSTARRRRDWPPRAAARSPIRPPAISSCSTSAAARRRSSGSRATIARATSTSQGRPVDLDRARRRDISRENSAGMSSIMRPTSA